VRLPFSWTDAVAVAVAAKESENTVERPARRPHAFAVAAAILQ
jgi:hypothetical protein